MGYGSHSSTAWRKGSIWFSLWTRQSCQPAQVTQHYLYPHKQAFLHHSFQLPPTTGHGGGCTYVTSHTLYISLRFLAVLALKRSFTTTLTFSAIPFYSSYCLGPTAIPSTLYDSSDWSNLLYPLPPPYRFGIHMYRILPTLNSSVYSSKTSLLISTSTTCHRTQKTITCTIPAMNTSRPTVLLHVATDITICRLNIRNVDDFNTLRTGLLNCLNARSRGLTFRHRASCI